MKIIIANPAGNITALVPCGGDISNSRTSKTNIANQIQHQVPYVEQVGFIIAPKNDSDVWRLEMAGGEFCGNAARSFALYAAREVFRATGKFLNTILVSISGCETPLTAHVSLTKNNVKNDDNYCEGEASISMPLPRAVYNFIYDTGVSSAELCAFDFGGITHIIADGGQFAVNSAVNSNEDKRALFFSIAQSFYNARKRQNSDFELQTPPALGVMFLMPVPHSILPAVYVRAADTLVFESSCGSGTAAYACYRARQNKNKSFCADVSQPGGVISVKAALDKGIVTKLSIGGTVTLTQAIFG